MKHYYIEGEWINALISIFAGIGLDTDAITKNIAGFKDERLLAGYRLEVSAARELWHRADKQAKDTLLGFKVGSELNFRAIGVLAPVIWHSPCVSLALHNIIKFQSLISESGQYHVNAMQTQDEALYTGNNDNEYTIEYHLEPARVPANPHQVLAVVVGTISAIKAISNNMVNIKYLHVPSSLNARLLSTKMGCKVLSQKDSFAICFCTKKFEQPLLGCDNNLYRINIAYAEELLQAKKASIELISKVKVSIANTGFSRTSIEHVELSLDIHKRTLQRKLTEQGTSFRQLKEEVLKTHAVNLLLENEVDIESISTYLGYSEPSAFHRAFKSWFSVTPRNFYRLRNPPNKLQ